MSVSQTNPRTTSEFFIILQPKASLQMPYLSGCFDRCVWMEIEKICCITTGCKVVWCITLKSIAFIKCDSRLQDRGSLKHNTAES